MWYEILLKRGLVPDFLLRGVLRVHNAIRKRRAPIDIEVLQDHLNTFIDELKQQPISIHTKDANEQHYEVPTEFFSLILGPNMKYSCGWWLKDNKNDLAKSEEDMLRLSCERANIQEDESILDLGCGWGSLSLYLAEHYSLPKIISVSNSATQKAYIESQATKRGIDNLEVITADVKELQLDQQVDKIMSIEMFEHMRNYKLLLEKLAEFLKPNGGLFIHIFTDREYPYFFEADNESNWMARYFFSGGVMPSADLLLYFDDCFSIEKVWKVNGTHYQKTLEAWLKKMDKQKREIMDIFKNTYGKKDAKKFWHYWRVFLIACSEAFGRKNGQTRFVTHYYFKKR